MIFAAKTVALVANVQNTLVWSGADFQSALGYAQPEKPISMTFAVQNNTAQVCYVAISYQTRNITYNINNRKSIAGIPANTTLRLASNLAPELASLGPDLISVTIYLISAGAGTVSISAEGMDSATSFGVGGAGGQNVGLDQRAVSDYVVIILTDGQTVPAVSVTTKTYTVPAGKRTDIISINAEIDPTPFGYNDARVSLSNAPNTFKWVLKSMQFIAANVYTTFSASLEAGDVLTLAFTNSNPAVSRSMSASVMLKEYFS